MTITVRVEFWSVTSKLSSLVVRNYMLHLAPLLSPNSRITGNSVFIGNLRSKHELCRLWFVFILDNAPPSNPQTDFIYALPINRVSPLFTYHFPRICWRCDSQSCLQWRWPIPATKSAAIYTERALIEWTHIYAWFCDPASVWQSYARWFVVPIRRSLSMEQWRALESVGFDRIIAVFCLKEKKIERKLIS